MSDCACCDSHYTRIHTAYLQNGGKYLRRNDDGTLTMVNSIADATWFYIYHYCSPADQRMHFHLLNNKDDINGSFHVDNKITKNGKIVLKQNLKGKSHTNFYIKYYFDEKYELDKVSFIMEDTGYKDSTHKLYAFDNYGDGRVVWWETNERDKYYSIKTKDNQKFKVEYIEKDMETYNYN